MNAEQPPIRAFLSYSHADDAEFGMVDPLVNKLQAYVRAKSGRALEVFVDRDAIGWGTTWRESISSSIKGATVFIPLLSANYLDSSACREEFLAFHSKAEALGVTELLLPILLFRSPLFGEGVSDDVAQIAESLQYKVIEDALVSGYDSPEWLRCTLNLAQSLLDAIARAEAFLLASAENPPFPSASGGGHEDPVTAEEQAGLAELLEKIDSATDRMLAATESLNASIEALGRVPEQVGELSDGSTPKEMNLWTLRLANEFREPAKSLELGGRDLFEAVKSLDEALSEIQTMSESIDMPEVSDDLIEGRKSLVDGFGDLGEVAESMEELLNSLKPAELLSVPLRKALQPARRGITSVRDSLKLIESWQSE